MYFEINAQRSHASQESLSELNVISVTLILLECGLWSATKWRSLTSKFSNSEIAVEKHALYHGLKACTQILLRHMSHSMHFCHVLGLLIITVVVTSYRSSGLRKAQSFNFAVSYTKQYFSSTHLVS